ncbi:beta-ketoacyl-[acyl-carrier-protein] synthase family protein [Dyella caseinilytica]|uniref:Beta-ketoacyl-[acyl-carrier-protein] synthase family protein n=1 Tax=Dyella caseinilytica TaxID=1849581 RepID=A0ABX7GW71_9GAMM|nr:beta-ketoacyl-[acyl-carrier-protein] synthase family protein [Dyella caseinilytica]QRN54727.1 beta-ketoacyl-[acyl-carrier-protein] synthase family protein [Dyella caseinilytica]GFZ96373.1 beta-ketoacyl-[acyl-carrier-protein] synthase II [Dyella caseinilytica]
MNTYLNSLGIICNLGAGKHAVAEALFAGDDSGIRPKTGWIPGHTPPLGSVRAELPLIPDALRGHRDNRNNRLLLAAALEIEPDIRAAIERYGHARIGVVLGTSTTGIEEATHGIGVYRRDGAWPADYRYAHQELGAPAAFLAEWLELSGPCYSISTACTSGARALLSAQRLLRMGVCDAVLCGGVDTLCRLAINGFHALEAVDLQRCDPFSKHRRGINIGEAAALFLMTRETSAVQLLGGGASSDAYHMSSPDPQGNGAQKAMRDALHRAGLDASQIDYINLHGTATEHNDSMESLAVTATFGSDVACSSTKSLTGHTLAAAGALEAAFCWLSLTDEQAERRLPPHVWDGEADPALLPLHLIQAGSHLPAGGRRYLMSNSFAFGGNNASLILGDPA